MHSQIKLKTPKLKTNGHTHLKDVNLDFSNTTDTSILINIDMPTLHIGQEIRKGKPNEPIAIKTIFGWVLMGGKSEKYHNCVTSNKLNLQNLDTLSESVERFWELETFGTRPKADLTLLPKNEGKAIKVLEVTVAKTTDSHYSVGLLKKEHRPILPFNRDLAIMR